MTENQNTEFLAMTADLVSAYVSNNPVPAQELPALIAQVHQSLFSLQGEATPAEEVRQPAVNPKKSVFNDYIICLEDGKKYKSLKRHISVHYGLTPDQYREKWSLPRDYPMVAPGYAAARSELAKRMGLGRQRKGTVAIAEQTAKPTKRGKAKTA